MRRLLVLTLLVVAAPASASAATTRYASPGGSGSACTQAAPCSLPNAIAGAASGDTVIVGTGTYDGLAGFTLSNGVALQGAVVGLDRPVLNVTGGVTVTDSGTTATDLELRLTGTLNVTTQARADRVIARSSASTGCHVQNAATLTNSLCTSATGTGLATPTSGAVVRNVTMYGQTGLFVTPGSNPTVTNSAFEGTTSDAGFNAATLDHDLWLIPSDPTPATSANGVNGHGTYRDKVAGDFRPVAGSLTTGNGTDTGVGAGELDLDGNLRRIGLATDIGAYELPPTPAASAAPLTTTATTASLTGNIKTGGGRGEAFVAYGPGFIQQTAHRVIPATLTVTSLAASFPVAEGGTPYRLTVISDGGTGTSANAVAYRAPTVALRPATAVTARSATVNGTVALHGAPSAKVQFVYGPATTPAQTIGGDGPVSAAVTGLAPRSTYEVKLRVTRGTEVFESPLGSFTTAGTSGTGTGPGTPTATKPSLQLKGRRRGTLLLRRRSLSVRVRCGDSPCRANASGVVRAGKKRLLGRLPALRSPLRLGKGERGTISLATTKALRKRVRASLRAHPKRRVFLTLKATFRDAAGTRFTRRLRIRVRLP